METAKLEACMRAVDLTVLPPAKPEHVHIYTLVINFNALSFFLLIL